MLFKGANIEDNREQTFVMIKGNQHYYFKATSEKEAKEWTEYLWRAILLMTPDLVQFKIEPMQKTKVNSPNNQRKVLTFK